VINLEVVGVQVGFDNRGPWTGSGDSARLGGPFVASGNEKTEAHAQNGAEQRQSIQGTTH
jgi:hypothetical protein